ncbi:phosphoenolpyruvate synthase [Sphingosinicella humi]|uniref:Phosphoenolpyruvate synthase n=1 Tax=Allosphingosinicella humi TaxID=2068657 RepID=A0A2U2J3X0_9SPHN|nr:phosphoenolpyruvate synthase [Sphingosinicella humi]PWG03012.1 phosphoenolpyruvate synthase [Sphingosinicella humi]
MQDVIWFNEIGIGDVARVGGKNASLGEMTRALTNKGIRVPGGFATTAGAYRRFIELNRLEQPMQGILTRLKDGEIALREAGRSIRSLILGGTFSPAMTRSLESAYDRLAAELGVDEPAVAVRSSATAEDLGDASFAGQQETFLNVRGKPALLDACRRCYASLFTDRAISYRELKGFGHLDVSLSVGVQHMVRADLAGSGVMFTLDTETGFPNVVVISAAWGLGETVVQGLVDPDRYVLFKPLLGEGGCSPLIEKSLGAKAKRMILARHPDERTQVVPTAIRQRKANVLNDAEILELGRWGVLIEAHYGRPMDIEWAKDGETGLLYILQARPETVHSSRKPGSFELYRLKSKGPVLLRGTAIGTAIAVGETCVIRSPKDIHKFRDGAVLVTDVTNPDWVPIMKRAAGIVTDHGGSTSHAAIVSRELGVPAVIGTSDATSVLREGQPITLSCAEGEKGTVYDGKLAFTRETIETGDLPETRTALMVNLADPAAAFRWWPLPARGVGLARMEFIISSGIKMHPMAAAHPERLDPKAARQVRRLANGGDPADYFVDTLSMGIARLAALYHPHPAIVRLSDFKTNEYASLIGGHCFETVEENPMLGFRGASRYYSERYCDGFALECRALKRVREEMGFTNVIVMVPFCRTPAEADKVLAAMAGNGLRRGEARLQIYMMCEIPSNVILADAFAARFDGFSIGSNDLTQLILGVDRDAAELASLFDERDEAVKRLIEQAIETAHRSGIKVGICGQAPSDHPEYAPFLVGAGIDSMSLNPDSFVKTLGLVARAEAAIREETPTVDSASPAKEKRLLSVE